jgi:hypothetical protein
VWYSEETTERPLGILESACPACGQQARLLLKKREKSGCIWVIPWWSSSYFVTCGNCFVTFKIDKELGKQIERAEREAERSAEESKRLYKQRAKQLQEAQQVMRCFNCGFPITTNQGVCGACGARLATYCPRCGASISHGYRFCGSCGARLY